MLTPAYDRRDGLGVSYSSNLVTYTGFEVGRKAIFNIYVNSGSSGSVSVTSYTGLTGIDYVESGVISECVWCLTYVGDVTDPTVTFTLSRAIDGGYNLSAYQA